MHPECVYWNKNTSSWAQDGLITIVNNVTGEVTCTSDHLTDFSVKVESSFGAVDDILASPFDEKVSNPEELMALLYKNVVVIVTMIITFSFFVFSKICVHPLCCLAVLALETQFIQLLYL